MSKRLVYICDWLPPDFGAVGQYAMLFARQWANDGWDVTLVGLTSGQASRRAAEPVGRWSLQIWRVHRGTYQKQTFLKQLPWTARLKPVPTAPRFRAEWQGRATLVPR